MGAQFNVPANPGNPIMLEIVTTAIVPEEDGSTQEFKNIYHYAGRNSNPGMNDIVSIGNQFMTMLNSNLPAVLSVDYTDAFATVRMLDDATALPQTLTAPSDGTVSGDRLPSFNAVPVEIKTSARGRCFMGRKHYGPIAESQTNKDELTSGAVVLWDAVIAAWLGALTITDGNGNSYDFCVLSRINSVFVGSDIRFTFALVTNIREPLKLGTMKRRKENVGA